MNDDRLTIDKRNTRQKRDKDRLDRVRIGQNRRGFPFEKFGFSAVADIMILFIACHREATASVCEISPIPKACFG